MRYDIGFMLNGLQSMQGVFGCAPDLRPDLSGLTRAKLPVVVLALLNSGMTDIGCVDAYLDDHGSPFAFEALLDVVEEYRTTGYDTDGIPNGLWQCLDDGLLKPNLSVSH